MQHFSQSALSAIRPGAEPFRFSAGSDVACIVVHGWAGSPSELRPLGRHLASLGVTAIGVRLPGHGTSVQDFARATWRDWQTTVARAFEDARTDFGQVFLCGFSLGGTLALQAAARFAADARLAGVATINAPVTIPRWYFSLRHLRSLLLPGQIAEASLTPAEPAEEARAVYYPNPPLHAAFQARRVILAAARELAAVCQPLLTIQSRQDRSISPRDAERIQRAVASPRKQLVWLENSRHLTPLDGDAPRVRVAISDFVRTTDGWARAPAHPSVVRRPSSVVRTERRAP
jgi:carboxylesterase